MLLFYVLKYLNNQLFFLILINYEHFLYNIFQIIFYQLILTMIFHIIHYYLIHFIFFIIQDFIIIII